MQNPQTAENREIDLPINGQMSIPRELQLLFTGKLTAHLEEIDHHAETMMDQLMTQMAAQEGVTEQLKAENQMEWVWRMNSIRSRAEEIVWNELTT